MHCKQCVQVYYRKIKILIIINNISYDCLFIRYVDSIVHNVISLLLIVFFSFLGMLQGKHLT